MNERIRELALRAGGGLSCIAEPLEHPWKFSQAELEKFAELIVREVFAKIEDERFEVYQPVKELVMKHLGVQE